MKGNGAALAQCTTVNLGERRFDDDGGEGGTDDEGFGQVP